MINHSSTLKATLFTPPSVKRSEIAGSSHEWSGRASCAREMPLLNSLGANGDASATRRLPRRRNLVRNALREVEQFFPREQWMTVVVQGDQTVRVTLFGGEHSRAFEQPAGAASTSTTIPQPTARSAPTAREISRNNRARLHQLSQGFYSKQLLRRAFRVPRDRSRSRCIRRRLVAARVVVFLRRRRLLFTGFSCFLGGSASRPSSALPEEVKTVLEQQNAIEHVPAAYVRRKGCDRGLEPLWFGGAKRVALSVDE